MNIAGQIFDIYDDVSYSVAKEHKDELSGSAVMDPLEVEKLADSKFALIIKTASGRKVRKYPIADKDSTKLSSVYFKHQKCKMHPAIAKKAEAGFSGNGDNSIDIANLASYDAVTHAYGKYPLHDASHVKEAMSRFKHTTQRMEPREKYAYAHAIVERAADLNLMVDGPVLGYVASEINPVSVKLGCLARRQSIFDKSLLSDLSEIESNPSPERFEQFDKVAGLSSYVSEGKIPDAYETCFSCIKVASLDDEKIKSISPTVIEQLFDPMFAKEWIKDPVAVYKSLPMPTQAMIDKQASVSSDAVKAIPAAVAMLAAASMARTYGANSVMDKQFATKGWVKDGQDGVIYMKAGERIVRKDGQYAVVDCDGRVKQQAESLPKLYAMLSGDYAKA